MKQSNRNDRGAVAVVVAVVITTLVMTGAAAIDIGKAVYARNNLQKSMDAAVIAAAADSINQPVGTTDAQISDRVNKTVKAFMIANATPSSADGLAVYDLNDSSKFTTQYVPANNVNPNTNNEDTVAASLKVSVPMSFYGLFGTSISFTIASRAKRPRPSPTEMAVVLDSTFSMNEPFGSSTKIAAAKASAKSLVALLMTADYAKIGLVPFAGNIRLDPAGPYFNSATNTSNASWLAFANYNTIYDCYAWAPYTCTYKDGWCYPDGVKTACKVVDKCTTMTCLDSRPRPKVWSGCIFPRQKPTNQQLTDPRLPLGNVTTIFNPTARPYVGFFSAIACTYSPMVQDLVTKGQTYTVKIGNNNVTKSAQDYLNYRIDNISVNSLAGGTYIPAALTLAWNMLTTETKTVRDNAGNMTEVIDDSYPLNSGFTATETQQRKVRKVVVLITDGRNSMYSSNVAALPNSYANLAYIEAAPAAQQPALKTQTDNEMNAVCRNINNAGITLYVIAVQFSAADLTFRDQLRNNCASGTEETKSEYFFEVATPAQLQAAFDKIGASFSPNTLQQ